MCRSKISMVENEWVGSTVIYQAIYQALYFSLGHVIHESANRKVSLNLDSNLNYSQLPKIKELNFRKPKLQLLKTLTKMTFICISSRNSEWQFMAFGNLSRHERRFMKSVNAILKRVFCHKFKIDLFSKIQYYSLSLSL